MTQVYVIDELNPEDNAMLQALYSRSTASVTIHLDKVRRVGSGRFMESYYVDYNHQSIGDCGSTTVYIEDVSILAAKAIEDWALYSGQETSTRYIDMGSRRIVDPIDNDASRGILQAWMDFYRDHQERVAQTVRDRHPISATEDPKAYAGAVKARTFDIMRGFLPAGITTQLSWHTNLRQAADHLPGLLYHPAEEIRAIGVTIKAALAVKYPSSGFSDGPLSVAAEARAVWHKRMVGSYTYVGGIGVAYASVDAVHFTHTLHGRLGLYADAFRDRPRGATLPHFLSAYGQCDFRFFLDYGSFRDIQRHRNGVCRMPLLGTSFGFETWYLDQLDDELRDQAQALVDRQVDAVKALTDDQFIRQNYIALGFRVPVVLTYGLPAAVYVMELRSGKAIHPTLRVKVHAMIKAFQAGVGLRVPLHVDLDPDDWDVRRGTQTITERA